MNDNTKLSDVSRRDFLKGGSLTSLMALMGAVEIRGQQVAEDAATQYKAEIKPVQVGVIGCGFWGREILTVLAQMPFAPVAGIADIYEPYLRRAGRMAPKATTYTDYRKLLENKEVAAVIVATPSFAHRQIVVDALQAGKHVYCEAPLANTIDDARAIAKAAKGALKLCFQAGLQNRSDSQLRHLEQFVRVGAAGKLVKARSQWHRKDSWRRTSPSPEQERAMNWRLRKETSTGLMGEIGIHQLDLLKWYIGTRPVAVTGFGSTVLWNDGRDVPDTIDAVVEFPEGIRFTYGATLANSFDGAYDMLHGTFSTIMIRERRAWMFKEVDAPLLGWEVYARKDSFYKETGIVLGANATKLAAQGDNPALDASAADEKSQLYEAMEAFLTNVNMIAGGVEDFASLFDESDTDALKEYLGSIKGIVPAADFQTGFEATVSAIVAHEAIMKRERIEFKPEWFEV